MLETVLIANRGEIAVRIIRACRMVNMRTVAIFSTSDALSLHVKLADEAYCLGSGSVQETYLNIDKIIEIAKKTNADGIHPGYGFLSENSDFARAVIENDLIFIGPSPAVLDALGDKVQARKIAREVGIPVVPGSKGYISTLEQAEQVAEEIGYPIIIKAAFGGGGKGMEIVHSAETLEIALMGCQSVAENFFGCKEVFIEKYIESPRHIEIQFLADNHGNVIHLGDRECSIQRSHQKLVEEAPSFLTKAACMELGEKVCRLAEKLAYSNAGTAEFLWKDGEIYFNEVNPRIQVEHPVTELITGIDLVAQQLKVANDEKLAIRQKDVTFHGNAIEFRINAEDSATFLPRSGRISVLIVPGGNNVRFDTFVYPQFKVSNEYDSLVGKLIVWGETRADAIERSKLALNELTIAGLITNIDLHKTIIESEAFVQRTVTTDFIEKASIKEKIEHYEEMKVAALFTIQEKMKETRMQTVTNGTQKTVKTENNRWKQQSKLEQQRSW